MENKRRLTDLFCSGSNEYPKLEDIYVESILVCKANSRVDISVSGVYSLEDCSSLCSLISAFDRTYHISLYLKFTDVSDGDYSVIKPLSALLLFYLVRDYSFEFINGLMLFNVGFDCNSMIITLPEYVRDSYLNSSEEEFKNAVVSVMRSLTSLDYGGATCSLRVVFESSSDSGDEISQIIAGNDMQKAFAVLNETVSDSGRKRTSGQSRSAKSDEISANPKDAAVDTNSWEFKAKAGLKDNKKNETYSYRRSSNAQDVLFGKVKQEAKLCRISELGIGDTDVNVCGQITISDDLRLTKSCKSVIAKYMIMDDSDAISCISFLKPDEADRFQKLFAKGGYAGLQGNVENDSYSGEIQFKVSGGFPADKPANRQDNARLKRVELHVHTKMSENDATSEPADLIKLAAAFGHSACAVTDHGVVQAFPHVYNAAADINKKLPEGTKPFKCILGCEGYLVDDGPTVFYNLPYYQASEQQTIVRNARTAESSDEADGIRNDIVCSSNCQNDESSDASLNFMEKTKAVGSFVAITVTRNGDDECRDTFTEVAAVKFRLKGYRPVRKEEEGESDASAQEFASHDIDKSLWNEDEIPEKLRDENISTHPAEPHKPIGIIYNRDRDIDENYSDTADEVVPDDIVFEHVADFYARFDDAIYPGKGEPAESYFAMGELADFIGESYVTGDDIFRTLSFVRRAGYGINIEDHKYYRHKFLMPATCDRDLLDLVFEKKYADANELLKARGIDFVLKPTGTPADLLLDRCYVSCDILIQALKEMNTTDPDEINMKVGHSSAEKIKKRKESPAYHIIYLARTNLGLYNMYRLVSESHIHYYSTRPRTPKSLLKYYRSALIVGGSCERGEIYRFVISTYKRLGKDRKATVAELASSEKFREIMDLYDYVEIQPLGNNMFITREDPGKSDTGNCVMDADDIRIINELLVEISDIYKKPCCATTDSHYLNKNDGIYRKYLLMSMGFKDAELQSDLYFRTTDEMLDEFSYLGEDKAMEVVVTNTNLIADRIEYGIKPFPDGTYPPQIARAAADVRDIAYTRANRLYRHNGVLNSVVKARLDKELESIIGHGYAIMYYIAYRLVKKSNNDGYIVGSRGSVGSSFTATMCGISEVNPLAPHYRCPKCNYVEFDDSGEFGSGYDMPEKKCPDCGEVMNVDGQDIPFETFLGFYGDKQPDIDLNFSGDYQPRAHSYVGVLFGGTHTFKAGTIGAFQEKNAYGIVRKICDNQGIPYTQAHLAFMSKDILGVKRTTSQHPGGIVVVPKEMDVYEFTPIQFPANKTNCGIITTHFDFHAMHDTILKLDILGHADPTVLRMLSEITDIDVTSVPVPDRKVMKLLESTDVLGFPEDATDAGSATLGLSELGTHMAREMIKETKPTRFYDLVQLMGLSHGTDVWNGNAQDLIKSGTCDLNSVIGCRDSIMTTLIHWGLPNKDSFDIMEKVRKGKGLTPEHEALMKEHNVPSWYIGSCKKIKYMFPKAHAAAYSLSTLRVAWFKVYRPEEYYCAFFTIRGESFDAESMCFGPQKTKAKRVALAESMRSNDNPNVKNEFYLCEIVEEMYARNIVFDPVSLYESDATRFVKVSKGHIRPPFCAIESISAANGIAICDARRNGPFRNREEFMNRTGIGQSGTQKLLDYGGIIDDLPESAQINMFDILGVGDR